MIELIGAAPDGAIGNGSSVAGDHLGDYGDMTPDGRFVVFASAASNLVPATPMASATCTSATNSPA